MAAASVRCCGCLVSLWASPPRPLASVDDFTVCISVHLLIHVEEEPKWWRANGCIIYTFVLLFLRACGGAVL